MLVVESVIATAATTGGGSSVGNAVPERITQGTAGEALNIIFVAVVDTDFQNVF